MTLDLYFVWILGRLGYLESFLVVVVVAVEAEEKLRERTMKKASGMVMVKTEKFCWSESLRAFWEKIMKLRPWELVASVRSAGKQARNEQSLPPFFFFFGYV